ncbi:MAG: hypothetical protein ACK5N1_11295, partial [Gemmatimonas sp.]
MMLCALPLVSPLVAQRATRCGVSERVKAVAFEGSPAFDGLAMAATIVTRQPGFATRVLRLGTAPCLDSLEVRRDALRLAILHRQSGWFQASVAPVITRRPDGVRVRFVVTPGREALLDTIRVQGMPQPLPGRRPYDAPLLALQGQRFDRTRVDTTVSSVVAHLRDAGFARAGIPASHITIDSTNARVSLDLTFEVGRRMQIGEVHVAIRPVTTGRPRVDSADVARLVAIDPGDRFRASALLDAQRALYRSEAFRLVLMDTVTPATGKDSVLDLRVSVAEARTRAARVGRGWATQDCVRVQG